MCVAHVKTVLPWDLCYTVLCLRLCRVALLPQHRLVLQLLRKH
jgi:hypothetical protein